MKLFKSILIILITASLYSCGPAVATVKTTDDNLNSYRSFSYLPNAALQMPNKSTSEGVNSIIIQSVNDNMIDAGYKLDRDNPDLLVLVSTKVNEETEVEKDPIYASYGYYNRPGIRVNSYYNNYYYYGYTKYPTVVGYDTDTYNYKEGTLVIYLVDKETNETVWKGASSTSIYDSGNIEAMTQLVNAIFKEYPLMQDK